MSHSVRENRHGNLCWELCWARRAVCLSARPSFWPHGLVLPQQGKKKNTGKLFVSSRWRFSQRCLPLPPGFSRWKCGAGAALLRMEEVGCGDGFAPGGLIPAMPPGKGGCSTSHPRPPPPAGGGSSAPGCGVSAHFSVPVRLPWRSPSAAPASHGWGKEKHRVSRAISCISWEAPRGRAGFCLKNQNKRGAALAEVTALLPSPAQRPARRRSPFPGGLLPSWRFSRCCRQSPVWLRSGVPPALGRSR